MAWSPDPDPNEVEPGFGFGKSGDLKGEFIKYIFYK